MRLAFIGGRSDSIDSLALQHRSGVERRARRVKKGGAVGRMAECTSVTDRLQDTIEVEV